MQLDGAALCDALRAGGSFQAILDAGREGRAPTSALKTIFERVRQWMLKIYDLAEKIGAPISDEMRGVFDRMHSLNPDKVVVAEGPKAAESFAERHKAAAAAVEPEKGLDLGNAIGDERNKVAEAHLPEDMKDARLERTATQDSVGTAGGQEPDRDGNAAEPAAAPRGADQEPGDLGAGGGNGPSEAPGSRLEDANPGPSLKNPTPEAPHAKFESEKAGNIRLENLDLKDVL